MFFITAHHMFTFGEPHSHSVTSWRLSCPIHSNCACWLLTHDRLLHQKNKFCWGTAHPLQCGEAFLKQTVFLSPNLCMLPSRPNDACKYTIFSLLGKHHSQLIAAGLILNLLGGETCKGSSEMICVCSRHCPMTPESVWTWRWQENNLPLLQSSHWLSTL
jgi:hypothetical protein